MCRSRGSQKNSLPFSHQADEDFFQGTLSCLEIVKFDARCVEVCEQGGDIRALCLLVGCVDQLAPVRRELQTVAGKLARDFGELAVPLKRHLFLATLAHELGFVLDQNRSEDHTSELQSRQYLVCRLLLA